LAAVEHQRRAFPDAGGDVAGHLVAVDAAVTSGPMSTFAVSPAPTFSFFARSTTLAIRSSAQLPTATATEIAMQRSPAEP
jgi:hypothetical protein